MRVVRVCPVEACGRGVIDGHSVLALRGVGQHVGVLVDAARQALDGGLKLPGDAGGEYGRAVGARLGGGDGAGGPGAHELVAVQRVAGNGLPAGSSARVRARQLDHHGKRRARGERIATVGTLVMGRAVRQHERLLGRDVAAVDPLAAHAVLVGRDERAARRPARRVLGLHVLQVHLCGRRAVAVGHARLFQHEVRVTVRRLVVKRDGLALVAAHAGVRQDKLAVGVRCALGNEAVSVVALVGAVELEAGAGNGVAVLVNLVDVRGGLRVQVVPERHVRGIRAALQVEELERVLRVGGKRVAREAVRALAGSRKELLERSDVRRALVGRLAHRGRRDGDVARVEVDV